MEAIRVSAERNFGSNARVWLFGSRVEEQRAGGDIDLYVEPEIQDPDELVEAKLHFLMELHKKLGEQKIDVVIRRAAFKEDMPIYREEVEKVRVEAPVQNYIVKIIRSTRDNRHLMLGASPRAAITLLMTAKAIAAIRGRDFVTPDDVKTMARPVLRHRLVLKPESEIEGFTGDRIVESVLQSVEVPR